MSARTKTTFPVSRGRNTGGSWAAEVRENNGNALTVAISSPASAPIGWYTMSLQISSKGRVSSVKLGTFVLLFNPWLQGRSLTTYTPSPFLSNEYKKKMGKFCVQARV